MSYIPSRETMLGRLFIQRFPEDYAFILKRITDGTEFEQICAFDLLVFLTSNLYCNNAPLPDELRDSPLPVPAGIRAELEECSDYGDYLTAYTLGEVLSNVHSGGG